MAKTDPKPDEATDAPDTPADEQAPPDPVSGVAGEATAPGQDPDPEATAAVAAGEDPAAVPDATDVGPNTPEGDMSPEQVAERRERGAQQIAQTQRDAYEQSASGQAADLAAEGQGVQGAQQVHAQDSGQHDWTDVTHPAYDPDSGYSTQPSADDPEPGSAVQDSAPADDGE